MRRAERRPGIDASSTTGCWRGRPDRAGRAAPPPRRTLSACREGERWWPGASLLVGRESAGGEEKAARVLLTRAAASSFSMAEKGGQERVEGDVGAGWLSGTGAGRRLETSVSTPGESLMRVLVPRVQVAGKRVYVLRRCASAPATQPLSSLSQSYFHASPSLLMSPGDKPPKAGPDSELGRIRVALQTRAHATSLRGVAREVGMTPSGLQKVLDGGESYPKTRQKLQAWYRRHEAGDYRTAQDVALEALLRELPEPRRARARVQIRAILRGEDPCA